ncbi:unnamed protein product [Miscanthus lutarioriparius]|uniref:Uncharacterized protein n=1 Tax=Miscanthus lutarioriparius TaxID=422564 RepID=A0A811R7K9_9POAL|nr:unnamed protein product [Miscanthus lutarioriparius]
MEAASGLRGDGVEEAAPGLRGVEAGLGAARAGVLAMERRVSLASGRAGGRAARVRHHGVGATHTCCLLVWTMATGIGGVATGFSVRPSPDTLVPRSGGFLVAVLRLWRGSCLQLVSWWWRPSRLLKRQVSSADEDGQVEVLMQCLQGTTVGSWRATVWWAVRQ